MTRAACHLRAGPRTRSAWVSLCIPIVFYAWKLPFAWIEISDPLGLFTPKEFEAEKKIGLNFLGQLNLSMSVQEAPSATLRDRPRKQPL